MIQSHRALLRALLISSSALAFSVAGCHKNPVSAKLSPAAATSLTPSVKSDRASTNTGESNLPRSREAAPGLSLDELFLKDIRDAYFDYDSAAIRPDARETLHKSADFLRDHVWSKNSSW